MQRDAQAGPGGESAQPRPSAPATGAAADAGGASHDTGPAGGAPGDPATFSLQLPGGGRMQVPPWVQLVGLPLAVVFAWLFVRAASHAVLVFLIATLISLLLNPVVRNLVRAGVPRAASVFLVFGAFAALVSALTIAAVDLGAEQGGRIRANAPAYADAALRGIDDLQAFVDRRGLDVDVRDQGARLVAQLEERSTELSTEALDFGREFVVLLAEAAFNVVLVIVITVYMLLDAPRIGRFLSSLLPAHSGVEGLFVRLERSLQRYVVGQTLASVVMGASAAIGLYIMGVTGIWEAGARLAVLFGVIVAITEFAPSIGPVVGAIPPVIVAAFDGVAPAVAVTIFFIILHQVEGHIVIPKLMGAAIAVHPLLVIFGILAGAQLLGVGGILLALPVLAVGREIVQYMRERVAFDRWPQAGLPALAHAETPGTADPVPAERAVGALAAAAGRMRARVGRRRWHRGGSGASADEARPAARSDTALDGADRRTTPSGPPPDGR